MPNQQAEPGPSNLTYGDEEGGLQQTCTVPSTGGLNQDERMKIAIELNNPADFVLLLDGFDLLAPDKLGFTLILNAAKGYGKLPNLPLLDFLLEKDEIPRMDKINALELAGAVILGSEENQEKFPQALDYWRRALTLGAEESNTLYKTPIKSKNMQLSEWSTLDDITEIELQPSLREIQSLCVRLRIYSGISSNAVHDHYLPYLFGFMVKGVDANRTLSEMMDISWATIEEIVRLHPIGCKLLPKSARILYRLAEIIRMLFEDDLDINTDTLKTFVKLVVMSDLFFSGLKSEGHVADYIACMKFHIDNLCDMFEIVYHIMSTHPEMITKDLEISLIQLVRRDCRDPSGFNVLHVICNYIDEGTVFVVRLLLKLTTDPNAVDNLGNTPLHILAKELEADPEEDPEELEEDFKELEEDFKELEEDPDELEEDPDELEGNPEELEENPEEFAKESEITHGIACLLLEAGAHLDAGNKEGKTPADLWLETRNQQGLNVVWADLPDWLKGGCPQLKCLCARIIRRDKLPYKDGSTTIPVTLIPFVDLH